MKFKSLTNQLIHIKKIYNYYLEVFRINFHSSHNFNLYNFLLDSYNRHKAFSNAVYLNNGSISNTCVYFVCEVLRHNNIKIPKYVANTSQLVASLQYAGWRKGRDLTNLLPGDICFTTDPRLNKNGTPTHAYIFMNWVTEGSFDFAYICDNQAQDYGGNLYHIRNIKNVATVKGKTKEPLSFFMYK